MKKRNCVIHLALAAALLCALVLAIVSTVHVAVLKNRVAANEREIAALENAAAENMGLQAGEYETLPYRIFVPEGTREGEAFPLVLYLHGEGRSISELVYHEPELLAWLFAQKKSQAKEGERS
jgi:predicted peptidase